MKSKNYLINKNFSFTYNRWHSKLFINFIMIKLFILALTLIYISSSYANQEICLTPDCKVKGIYTDKMRDQIKIQNNPLYAYSDTDKYGIDFVKECMKDYTYCVGSSTPIEEIPMAVRAKYGIGFNSPLPPKEKVKKDRSIHITFSYDKIVHQNILTITNNEKNALTLRMVYIDAKKQCTHTKRFNSPQTLKPNQELSLYLPKGCATGIVHQVVMTTTNGRIINLNQFDYE